LHEFQPDGECGTGAQIYGTADAFHFLYQQISGVGSIVARLASVQGGSTNASMGIMIRETLDPAAKNAKFSDWPLQNTIYFPTRANATRGRSAALSRFAARGT
jgi:hypothetical protein